MVATTVRTVTANCGHERTFDAAGMFQHQVEGRLKLYKDNPCPECDPKFKAKREKETAAWRAGQLKAAKELEARAGWAELEGSPKQVTWGTQVRANLVLGASEEPTTEDFDATVMEWAGQITAASWWIDHRDTEPAQLSEVLKRACTKVPTPECENPY